MILRANLKKRLRVIRTILIDRKISVGTVLQLEGTYYEVINFLHKELKVKLFAIAYKDEEIENKIGKVSFVNLESLTMYEIVSQSDFNKEDTNKGYRYLLNEYEIYSKLRVGTIYYGDLSKNYKLILNIEPLECMYLPYYVNTEKELEEYLLQNKDKLDLRRIAMLGEPKYIHYKGTLSETYVHKLYLKLKLVGERK